MITLPTIADLYAAILANLESEFNAIINPVGKAELRAQAAVQAALLKQQYLAIAQTQKNIWVDTCDEETLSRFGLIKLNRLPFAAVAGQYRLSVTGKTGAIIPALSVFKSDDSSLNPSILYILDNAHTLVSTSDTIIVRSLTLGIESKLNIGDTLTPTAPIPLVDNTATVTIEEIQPLAAETTEEYRTIVINAFRLEAQGGAATDYRIWAADAQGVERVYPYAKTNSPCEINIFIEATLTDSTDGKGTPSAQIISDVQSVVEFSPDTSLSLNERGRRPLQVIANYLPVTIKTLVITIAGFQGITTQIKSDLLSAFTLAVAATRPFVAAAEPISDKNDIIDTNKLNGIIYTTKPGSVYISVSFTVNGINTGGTFTFTNGDIPYLNPIIIYN